jgi:broad specificity phosphatase PhoE
MKRIMLVRHGESEWNSARRLQGQADIGLSRLGEEQAKRLRPVIETLSPDKAVSSDLERARRTASLLGYSDATVSSALREIDVGEWTGAEVDSLLADGSDDYIQWRAGTFTPPGGESWRGFRQRVIAGLTEMLADNAERLLVVCHGGVIRALLDGLIDLPPSRIMPVGPGSLTILAEKKGLRIETFNFSPGGPILNATD